MINYDKQKNEVFILYSSCNIPINFAKHAWFVLNEKGKLSRYEIRHFKSTLNKQHGYIHLNTLSPFIGIELFQFYPKFNWKSKLLKKIEDPIASKMISEIKSSINDYPYKDKYKLTGTNSNTYVQWYLNKYPETNVKLPIKCFGKKKNI